MCLTGLTSLICLIKIKNISIEKESRGGREGDILTDTVDILNLTPPLSPREHETVHVKLQPRMMHSMAIYEILLAPVQRSHEVQNHICIIIRKMRRDARGLLREGREGEEG